MYIKEKVIFILKIKNILLSIEGVFNIAMSVEVMSSLFSEYMDDLNTVLHAKATPDCMVNFIIGILSLVVVCISKRHIGNAVFYSRYFEGDLDGKILYSDLAELTGVSEKKIRLQIIFYRLFYMKGFKRQVEEGIEKIVLDSKVCTCECKSCGANIEKRMYFTGSCPYCGSSDLFAKILTDKRFYSIAYKKAPGVKDKMFYTGKGLQGKRVVFISCWGLGASLMIIAVIAGISFFSNLFSKEYYTNTILSDTNLSSYALIKTDLIDSIIFTTVLVLAMVPLVYNMTVRFMSITVAQDCSRYLAKQKTPFVLPKKLPPIKNRENKKKGLLAVLKALRYGYLINCSFEKHDGILKIALAKEIVKDRCPTCNAPIVGAVDENYICKYCGNTIMGVVKQK